MGVLVGKVLKKHENHCLEKLAGHITYNRANFLFILLLGG